MGVLTYCFAFIHSGYVVLGCRTPHLHWTVRRKEWLWVLDALSIADNLRSWWSGTILTFHGTHGCWLFVRALPLDYLKLACELIKMNGEFFSIALRVKNSTFNSTCTHFPYSSLLNFGRGEALLPFCANGFSNCPFWCSFTALLNMATLDESGESCKIKRSTKHINWLFDERKKTNRKKEKQIYETRLFTAIDDAAQCTTPHTCYKYRVQIQIQVKIML